MGLSGSKFDELSLVYGGRLVGSVRWQVQNGGGNCECSPSVLWVVLVIRVGFVGGG